LYGYYLAINFTFDAMAKHSILAPAQQVENIFRHKGLSKTALKQTIDHFAHFSLLFAGL